MSCVFFEMTMSQQAELLSLSSDAGEKVREFYDQHPYPPPVNDLEKYRQRWQDLQKRRADFNLFWPERAYQKNYSILIAGCGTSQAAKHALRWPDAQVIGIDSSETSVGYTEQLKKKYALENLQVHQLAVEQTGELGMQFDQIVCTGVLHHLADPDVGLSALRNVLKLDGAMQLMVYAPYGRAGIYMLQEFCRRVGIHPSNTGVRELVGALNALPEGHPLQNLLGRSPELRNEAALADSFLHPQDRAYSVPQFFDFIKRARLTFGRWLRQAPYSVKCGVLARIPQYAAIARLPQDEQYAAVELFRGTMVRHSAIVYRDDFAGMRRPVNFADDNWLEYVPIRMSDTICIQDRLPVGAAAVLINPTHIYKDLFLPINPAEKQLFDAIDGQRRIGEIIERTSTTTSRIAHLHVARKFFERLWLYDQVVFQTG
jgi:SAM-dependent methyltransferase